MQLLLVLIFSALLFAGCQTKETKKIPLYRNSKALNITINNFPFVVGFIVVSNHTVIWKCGGCIIHRQYALTTASCLIGVPTSLTDSGYFRVRSNTSFLEEDFEPFTDHIITQYYIHPGYADHLNTYDNNIAVVSVLQEFEGVNEKVIRIRLRNARPFQDYDNTMVFTWHKLILQATNVSLVNQQECQTVYQWAGGSISQRMVCGRVHGRDDFCQEMQGSPLVLDDQLLGLASFAHECSADHFPGVFTRVDMHREWIDSKALSPIKETKKSTRSRKNKPSRI